MANDFIPVFLKQIMTLKNVKSSLPRISKSLKATNASREFLIKNTRDVVILCSHSIIAAHKGDLRLAKQKIKKAEVVLKRNRKKAKDNFQKYLITPEQEFVEAHSFLAVIENKEIPSLKSLKVSEESYILGLLDCIGELKRLVLDNIRNGQLKKADRIFSVMENLYQTLYPFAMYDKIVKEARKINENMPNHVVDLLSNALSESNIPLNNSTIAILGVSYKPNIHDAQIAPSEEIIKILTEKNAKIKIFDPYFKTQIFGLTTEKSISDTLSESDAAILITGHKEFQNLDLKKFFKIMKNPVLVDCTGLVSPLDAKENGFIFRGIGRGDI